ncbi:OapC/ArvC family zinc-ribbon domain-containing protein [Halococcus sediminicola]|uniref:OapC/ArvC family zinc-ribbon domain-containing protein n=1 Tax=Halococcus sediminicola TaxID=1264579 RepID=UPI0006797075|nr:Zn-ribbon containing protein [Halococcus sediminicola]
MPHQCTDCGHTFPDGSKEMLSGCPDCGGNKFRFEPAADARASSATQSAADTADTPESRSADGQAPTQPPPTGDSSVDGPTAVDTEDSAQADARRDVASPDELAAGATSETGGEPNTSSAAETDPSSDTGDDGNDTDDDSEMAALRQELDDQFESIKILEPGQYELNLMELYNREEYIIALQEDGQYVIEVPESWHGD